MGLLDYTIKLLGLSETLHRWRGLIGELDAGRREKVARYADRIAETLSRAAAAFAALEKNPAPPAPRARPSASSAASPAMSRTSSGRWNTTLTDASWLALKGGSTSSPARSRCGRRWRARMPSASSVCWRPRATSGPWPTG